MPTDWNLIREVMNGTIDACQAIEKVGPDVRKGEYEARSDYQSDVNVADFLHRFHDYPHGSQRDIIRIRSHLGCDAKHLSEIARALVNTAKACAESIGVSDDALSKECADLDPHCETAGKTIERQLKAIPEIQNGWMLSGITKALEVHRNEVTKTVS